MCLYKFWVIEYLVASLTQQVRSLPPVFPVATTPVSISEPTIRSPPTLAASTDTNVASGLPLIDDTPAENPAKVPATSLTKAPTLSPASVVDDLASGASPEPKFQEVSSEDLREISALAAELTTSNAYCDPESPYAKVKARNPSFDLVGNEHYPDMNGSAVADLLRDFPSLAKGKLSLTDLTLAFRNDSVLAPLVAGDTSQSQLEDQWVHAMCPGVVEYFSRVPMFDTFPTYEKNLFPILVTTREVPHVPHHHPHHPPLLITNCL